MASSWSPPLRPAAYAEQSLISAILEGEFPPESTLPAERELAARLGITRPTLREALKRMERDGWLVIQQGKPTRVNDIWVNGGLNVLSALVRNAQHLPDDFIPNLLAIRLVLAPAYTRAAVEYDPQQLSTFLKAAELLEDTPESYAAYDWQLHHTLTISSGNPIFTLILNGFAGFYEEMAQQYFRHKQARQKSKEFYTALLEAVEAGDAERAEAVTKRIMEDSLRLWKIG